MWQDQRTNACHVGSAYSSAIAAPLRASGLRLGDVFQNTVNSRMLNFGLAEWGGIKADFADVLEPCRTQRLLGIGYAFTEFLAAPVVGPATPRTICSLGAIANLMVVICDRMLDSGIPVEAVLAENGMPKDATVSRLLDLYWRKFATMEADKSLVEIIQRVIRRMFAAEMETVRRRDELPYRYWLRKSALPFVLMGLPAWACRCRDNRNSGFKLAEHVRWLSKVGRFFGVLDDAADYEADIRSGDANYFRLVPKNRSADVGPRVANWGSDILREWDSLVIAAPKSAIFRETFSNITWGWLGSAAPEPNG